MTAAIVTGSDWIVLGVLAVVFVAVIAYDLHERRRREP